MSNAKAYRLTFFQNRFDNKGNRATMTWAQFEKRFSEHTETACAPCPSQTGGKCDARDVGLWSPALFNGSRKNDNVEEMEMLVFDLDHVPTSTIRDLDARIEKSNYVCLAHPSHSNQPAKNDWCLRLIFPLHRPIKQFEIARCRAALAKELELPFDPNSNDSARMYFLPSAPSGTVYRCSPFYGLYLVDPDVLLKYAPPVEAQAPRIPVQAAESEPAEQWTDLNALRKMLERNSDLKAAMNGSLVIQKGGRNSTLARLAGAAASLAPNAPPLALASLLEPSLIKWEPDESGRPWSDTFAEQYTRFSAQTLSKRKTLKEFGDALFNARKEDAVRSSDGSSEAPEDKHRIISNKDTHWIFSGGRYRKPVTSKDLKVSLMRDWAGEVPDAYKFDEKSGRTTLLPNNAILDRFSTVARTVVSDLSLRDSFYDPRTQTFYEAVCPLRPLEAEFSLEFDTLLDVLVEPSKVEKLKDWVASVMRLDKPCSALFLSGARGVGKTLLAYGLAKLWAETPTPFEMAIGAQFNDALTQCPLVFAEEGLPQNDAGDVMVNLRKSIGQPSRKLNRKFMSPTDLRGNPRIIIAANNAHTGKSLVPLEREDIAAISERVLFCNVREEARDYLNALKFGKFDINSFISHDIIAKHALWMSLNRPVKTEGRFLVSGDVSEYSLSLAAKNGQSPAVLEFLIRMLAAPTLLKDPYLKIKDGELYVGANLLNNQNHWSTYVPSRRMADAQSLGLALRQLSTETINENDVYFYKINKIALFKAVEDMGICTIGQIKRQLGIK